MRVGLIDVDGHNFPNLALMRISAYHKSLGDIVEWWQTDFIYYDKVYMSKIFSDAYSPDVQEPLNCGEVRGMLLNWAQTVKRCLTNRLIKICRKKLRKCFLITAYIRSLILLLV